MLILHAVTVSVDPTGSRRSGDPVTYTGVYFTTGTVSWTLDRKGKEVGGMFSGSGTVTDVCAELAN